MMARFLKQITQLNQRCCVVTAEASSIGLMASFTDIERSKFSSRLARKSIPRNFKFQGIDAFRFDTLRNNRADQGGNHQRQNNPVILGHFKKNNHGGDWCPRRTGKYSRHAHHGVGAAGGG